MIQEERSLQGHARVRGGGHAHWTVILLAEQCEVILEERLRRATVGRVMKRNEIRQVIANKYPDHNPTEENGFLRRDYEYVRKGTLSLLVRIDLLTGEAIP